ncbi:MAG: THUMP domain-containing protein [Thermoplasmata archaeon]
MKYLLRYGEIGLKSSRVRRAMKERLMTNIARLFRHEGGRCSFREEEGRLFLESEFRGADEILARAFGLVSYSPVVETSSSLQDMMGVCVDAAGRHLPKGPSFAVRVRRVGSHTYTSMDIAREIGSAILSAFPELRVNLGNPDWEVFLEIREGRAYLYSEVLRGPGGLPLGTQGRVVAYVEEPEGVLAAWLMMKRGCSVTPVFQKEEKWSRALTYWDPELAGRKVDTLREMERVAESEGALGYVYPWDVDGVGKDDLRPAFYPLLGLSQDGLEKLRQEVLGPLGMA